MYKEEQGFVGLWVWLVSMPLVVVGWGAARPILGATLSWSPVLCGVLLATTAGAIAAAVTWAWEHPSRLSEILWRFGLSPRALDSFFGVIFMAAFVIAGVLVWNGMTLLVGSLFVASIGGGVLGVSVARR